MRLLLSGAEMEQIREYLFRDTGERMIIALCRKAGWSTYRAEEWFYPSEQNYARRNEAAVTLRAEAVYPLIKKLRSDPGLSFQIGRAHV